jgi:uncharacterized protein
MILSLNNMQSNHALRYGLLFFMLLHMVFVQAQDIPKRPDPPRLVNDFANVFTAAQREELENKLVAYNDSTSTQIVVITIQDLGNYEIAQFSYKIGDEWGVGQKGKDNGIVITLAMKSRDVFIATGRGIEGALPDAICNRITDNEMIPRFRDGDYFGGVNAGIDKIILALAGEYKAEPGSGVSSSDKANLIPFIIVIVIILIILFTRKGGGGGGGYIGRGGYRPMSTGWGRVGSGGFGGGSFGGGGGFGGFGGGSFGGGGAGGRW